MSREFDLTHTWNRYVTESVILAEPSIFESTLYAASWLPFPFPDIDVVVAARGIDLADVSSWAALVVTAICAVLCCALLCSWMAFKRMFLYCFPPLYCLTCSAAGQIVCYADLSSIRHMHRWF